MPLLLQLDGNIPESPHHRRMLYIFGCRYKTCRRKPGSIRAIRGIELIAGVKASTSNEKLKEDEEKHEEETNVAAPKVNMGNMIFGGDFSSSKTNPFASGSSNVNPFASPSSTNPFASPSTKQDSAANNSTVNKLSKTFASVVSISDSSDDQKSKQTESTFYGPPSPWPDQSTLFAYQNFYLDASYEELDPNTDTLTKQAEQLAKSSKIDEEDDMEIDLPDSSKKASSSSKGKKEGKDDTGEDEAALQKTFDHFSSIASQNPEQVLRYERNGSPLLYSKADAVGKLLTGGQKYSHTRIPKCSNCGEQRVFELQLMPCAISVLEDASKIDVIEEGMEWGTVIVAACGVDCSPPLSDKGGGYVEEWTGVQWEEEVDRK